MGENVIVCYQNINDPIGIGLIINMVECGVCEHYGQGGWAVLPVAIDRETRRDCGRFYRDAIGRG